MEWILFLYLAAGGFQPPTVITGFESQEKCVAAGDANKLIVPIIYTCVSRTPPPLKLQMVNGDEPFEVEIIP